MLCIVMCPLSVNRTLCALFSTYNNFGKIWLLRDEVSLQLVSERQRLSFIQLPTITFMAVISSRRLKIGCCLTRSKAYLNNMF